VNIPWKDLSTGAYFREIAGITTILKKTADQLVNLCFWIKTVSCNISLSSNVKDGKYDKRARVETRALPSETAMCYYARFVQTLGTSRLQAH